MKSRQHLDGVRRSIWSGLIYGMEERRAIGGLQPQYTYLCQKSGKALSIRVPELRHKAVTATSPVRIRSARLPSCNLKALSILMLRRSS